MFWMKRARTVGLAVAARKPGPSFSPPIIIIAFTPAVWALAVAVCPVPLLQARVYDVLAAGRTTSSPSGANEPLQPPDAVQDTALVACQDSRVLSPTNTRDGVAPKRAMAGGAGGGPSRKVTVVDALTVLPSALRQVRP